MFYSKSGLISWKIRILKSTQRCVTKDLILWHYKRSELTFSVLVSQYGRKAAGDITAGRMLLLPTAVTVLVSL